jgi:hypothetical protein
LLLIGITRSHSDNGAHGEYNDQEDLVDECHDSALKVGVNSVGVEDHEYDLETCVDPEEVQGVDVMAQDNHNSDDEFLEEEVDVVHDGELPMGLVESLGNPSDGRVLIEFGVSGETYDEDSDYQERDQDEEDDGEDQLSVI